MVDMQPCSCTRTSQTLLIYPVSAMQVILMGGAESYRAAGEGPGLEGLDSLYPGTLPAQFTPALSLKLVCCRPAPSLLLRLWKGHFAQSTCLYTCLVSLLQCLVWRGHPTPMNLTVERVHCWGPCSHRMGRETSLCVCRWPIRPPGSG